MNTVLIKIVFCLMIFWGSGICQDFSDMRVYVDVVEKKWESKKNTVLEQCRIGAGLWETVLPELNVTFVKDKKDANTYFVFANYHRYWDFENPAPDYAIPACPHIRWGGCAPPGNIIYINTRYVPNTLYDSTKPEDVPVINVNPAFMDNFSMHDYWRKWQPATKPPLYYRGDIAENPNTTNPGYNRGVSARLNDAENSSNIAQTVAHEMGHWVGGSVDEHGTWTTAQVLRWYGRPFPKGGSQPTTPSTIKINNTPGFELFFDNNGNPNPSLCINRTPNVCEYYGGADCPNFSGGACHMPDASHPLDVWTTDFRWDLIANEISFMRYENRPTIDAGLPLPQFFGNMRFINDYDISYVQRTLQRRFPEVLNVIVMKKQDSDEIYLTSNWHDARSKMEYDKRFQYDYEAEKPKRVYLVVDVKSKVLAKPNISAGGYHVMAIRDNDKLYGWGKNSNAQLGGYKSDNGIANVIGDTQDWGMVSSGFEYSAAIKKDGSLWAWGHNASYQLGAGNTNTKDRPVQIGSASDWYTVSTGKQHTAALKSNGEIWVWGTGNIRVNGEFSSIPSPEKLYTSYKFTSISAGWQHTAALATDGTIWTWGGNDHFSCGVNSPGPQGLKKISTDKFEAISAGSYHNLALKADGTVWAWGSNEYGQLGNGSTKDGIHNIIQVPGLANIIFIEAGGEQSFAIRSDGTLWAWGNNSQGQLGLANITSMGIHSPTQVGDEIDWNNISAGYRHTVAGKGGVYIYTWGDNSFAQLGNGTNDNTHNPQNRAYFEHVPTINITSPENEGYHGYPIKIEVETSVEGTIKNKRLLVDGKEVDRNKDDFPWTSPSKADRYTLTVAGEDFTGETFISAPVKISTNVPNLKIKTDNNYQDFLITETNPISNIRIVSDFNLSPEVVNNTAFVERVNYSGYGKTFNSGNGPEFPWNVNITEPGSYLFKGNAFARGDVQLHDARIVNVYRFHAHTPAKGTIFKIDSDENLLGWYHWGEKPITKNALESSNHKSGAVDALEIYYYDVLEDAAENCDIGLSWHNAANGSSVTNSKKGVIINTKGSIMGLGFEKSVPSGVPVSFQLFIGVSKARAKLYVANNWNYNDIDLLKNPNAEVEYRVYTIEMYKEEESSTLMLYFKLDEFTDQNNRDGYIIIQAVRVKLGAFDPKIPFGGHLVSGVFSPLLLF